jgi:hypothetical protein
MPIAALDVATLIRDLLDEHAAINFDEIQRGEFIQGDVMSSDQEDVADFDLITDQGIATRVDMSDGTAFRIIVEEIDQSTDSKVAEDPQPDHPPDVDGIDHAA